MLRRWLALAAIAAPAMLVAPRAHAWVESHQASDDVRVELDPSGVAHVEHTIAYRVVRGPLHGFDLNGIEVGAFPESTASITTQDGGELTASVVVHAERSLRIAVDEPRALMRGAFVFHIRYSVDLIAAGELARDGTMWKLAWTAPVANEGFDGGHAVFVLPPAPEAPEPISSETGTADESIIRTLRRDADKDVLELVRPHVARDEQVAWTLRLDPRAFGDVKDPTLRPLPPSLPSPPDRVREASVGAGLLALSLVFGLLVAHKDRAFAAAGARRGARPALRSLGVVPLGRGLRATLAGILLGGGVLLELIDLPTVGAALVVAAMGLAAIRTPALQPAARGPGKWLAIRPEEAFVRGASSGHWLDVGCTMGKVSLALAIALVAALVLAVRRLGLVEAPYLLALDSLVLVPLFLTGRAAQLPPDRARGPVVVLSRLFQKLRRRQTLKVVPWARVPTGRAEPDELRLLALPRAPMPGLHGVEAGVAWGRTASGYAGAPELLARVEEGSAAAARLTKLLPGARPLPGRRPEERVFRLTPELSTRRATLALMNRVLVDLEDRRAKTQESAAPFAGVERRTPHVGVGTQGGE